MPQSKNKSREISQLLTAQARESKTVMTKTDPYAEEKSLKSTITFNYRKKDTVIFDNLLPLEEGTFQMTASHIWREGKCYPDEEAKNNHDLKLYNSEGALRVRHEKEVSITRSAIMPDVVTNREFEDFLYATGYKPRFPEYFLAHWLRGECPPDIMYDPVVYVSLEDARAYAEWAGMELPTQWEWQKAATQYPEKFKHNHVFEWNESERFDGFNRFVTLKGGASHWEMPSSWWYFPGAPYNKINGGPQPPDSHVKYFLMYPGMDRSATIGFRCIKK